MTRESKFRALKTVQTSSKKDEYNSAHFIYSNGYYFDGHNYWFIIPDKYPALAFAQHEIINIETLGQFTGLHDKNGTEIYEGDIIRHISNHYTYIGTVEFDIGYHMSGFCIRWNGMSCSVRMCKCEVIGNIHQQCAKRVIQ